MQLTNDRERYVHKRNIRHGLIRSDGGKKNDLGNFVHTLINSGRLNQGIRRTLSGGSSEQVQRLVEQILLTGNKLSGEPDFDIYQDPVFRPLFVAGNAGWRGPLRARLQDMTENQRQRLEVLWGQYDLAREKETASATWEWKEQQAIAVASREYREGQYGGAIFYHHETGTFWRLVGEPGGSGSGSRFNVTVKAVQVDRKDNPINRWGNIDVIS